MRYIALLALVFASCGPITANGVSTPAEPPLPPWHCEDPPDNFDELRKEAAENGQVIYWIRTPCTTKAELGHRGSHGR